MPGGRRGSRALNKLLDSSQVELSGEAGRSMMRMALISQRVFGAETAIRGGQLNNWSTLTGDRGISIKKGF